MRCDVDSWQLPYLCPPFPLTAACLNKIQEQAVKNIVMTFPFWPGKPWFSDFLRMAISIKRLPIRKDLVVDLKSGLPPPNLQTLKLVMAILSGKNGGVGAAVSNEIKSLMEAKWRKKTEARYGINWAQWLHWSSGLGISQSAPSLSQV